MSPHTRHLSLMGRRPGQPRGSCWPGPGAPWGESARPWWPWWGGAKIYVHKDFTWYLLNAVFCYKLIYSGRIEADLHGIYLDRLREIDKAPGMVYPWIFGSLHSAGDWRQELTLLIFCSPSGSHWMPCWLLRLLMAVTLGCEYYHRVRGNKVRVTSEERWWGDATTIGHEPSEMRRAADVYISMGSEGGSENIYQWKIQIKCVVW